ncbi:MAG: 30S ribosomal protein S27e [Methanospirillaceae archaeon]|nr:30S ribosomal protein S27e [Methanospirillaceae archaeon]
MVQMKRENRSRFLNVKCPDCEHEQLIFDKASSTVDCIICGHILARPTGGKARIEAEVVSVEQ